MVEDTDTEHAIMNIYYVVVYMDALCIFSHILDIEYVLRTCSSMYLIQRKRNYIVRALRRKIK